MTALAKLCLLFVGGVTVGLVVPWGFGPSKSGPRPDEAVLALAAEGWSGVTVVPLLLTAAYHARVDLPAVLDRAGGGLDVRVADVLGPVGGLVPAGLLAALRRRLADAGAGAGFDGVVLAAAGTRDRAALSTVDHVARALGTRLGVPCLPMWSMR